MTKTTDYHQDWAARMNRLTGSTDYDAAYIAQTELQAGKPYGEITREEFQAVSSGPYGLDILDAEGAAAAITRRGVKNIVEVAAILDPADDDYEAVVAAIKRNAPELLDGVKRLSL